jgi:predicted transcriptional regulator
MSRYYVHGAAAAFSVTEETDFYRMRIGRPEVNADDVEDFLDTTIEWLSSNPTKGILLDFTGVRSVCANFTAQLKRNYEDIKARGLYVRFVNVDPAIGPYVDVQNITVVVTIDPGKPVLSARTILADLADNLTDQQLMKKHGLSAKGLQSMFGKLLHKGLVSKDILGRRAGTESPGSPPARAPSKSPKASVNASDVLKDIEQDVPDTVLMRKYKLSPKGLKSVLEKLRRKGLISTQTLSKRKMARLALDSSSDHTARSTRGTSSKKKE